MKKGVDILHVLLMATGILFFAQCKKDKNIDCGCSGEITRIISDTNQLVGKISYKKQLDANDNFYNNTYWIGYTDSAFCSICSVSFILCNEDILSSELKQLKNYPDSSIDIKYSGYVKELCQRPFDISEHSYYHIFLTKIEKR